MVLQSTGKAEQYIKEGKNAIKWTRLSCRKFRDNAVRLQLHALAYNLANFMRTLALPNLYEFLEAEGYKYAIRLKANKVLQESVAHLLTRPVGRPPNRGAQSRHLMLDQRPYLRRVRIAVGALLVVLIVTEIVALIR